MPQDSVMQAVLRVVQLRTFADAYRKTFEVVEAGNNLLREQAFRLRYQVYCEDNRFIIPGGPEGLETDSYDERARHFLLMHKASGEAVGTVRVIPPNRVNPDDSFPLQENCDHPLLLIDEKIGNLCEISRLCMVKNFRRRPMDGKILPAYYEAENFQEGLRHVRSMGRYFRRRIPYAPLGLLRAAFGAVMDAGALDVVMGIDPQQLRTLKRLGLSFRPLGAPIDTLGQIQPLVFNIKNALDTMALENPECWEIASNQGQLHKRATMMVQDQWHDNVVDDTCRAMIMRRMMP